ncbi:helix-turn-helix domain-containing protein [Pedobacter frigidisoli]|uniref:Helix-turn-helix domain-containing protein n=1 Tax=Pedobacter frigidisoli TaxID=2530455 RepID=A0A4R0NAP2_9SPHI|nr:helix-turn-helix domain-containing protein [Pedobacter frigidisoli]TCC97331.1 helix-turn-helix domain-containing protein [Pedobacter frigidisoli]
MLSHPIDFDKLIIYNLHSCPEQYLQGSGREEYFEMIWFSYKDSAYEDQITNKQYAYLIPPFRSAQVDTNDMNGYLISFKREYLEEDDKEYALEVFKLFNMQGQYSIIPLDSDVSMRFKHLFSLLIDEYQNPKGTYLVLKSLLKVFLLNLIRLNQDAFLIQDTNQKRVYEFIVLMEKYYKTERKASFYCNKLGLGEKRLNQILKEKMNKSLTQLLHIRLIVEAKRKLIKSDQTIKEIAYDLNFEDRGYFTRFFKKLTGQTPKDFKNGLLPDRL